ncbi:MAG TPA: TIGR03960 family B12-binding radical SAM protein [Coriobacteriia bacterium]
MSDLWTQVEPLLAHVERPARYIDSEFGAVHRPEAAYRVALLYPDTYELGMANQAIAILYDRLNGLDGVAAERAYVPWKDMGDAMRAAGVPLFTLESVTAVRSCDLFGITMPYELTCTNICEALDLAGIALRAGDREETDPVVIGGGPCAFNPEPVADFFDAILVGEGEDAIVEIVAAHRAAKAAGLSRAAVLRTLAAVSGVYVPTLYEPADRKAPARPREGSGAPAQVVKRVVADLGSHRAPTCPVVPFMDVIHDRANVEVLRGCTRGCRFCQAGMIYRPVRERTSDDIVRDALEQLRCTGQEELSLTSLSTTDHSEISDVLRRLSTALRGRAVTVSLPSLRLDSFGVDMARLVSEGSRGGLTFAPEAGTQRLRDVINKNITEDDLLGTVRIAFEEGWRRLKLYFMIGLPTETDDDVRGIGELVSRVLAIAREVTPPAERGGIRIAVSVSTFVPKAHTPFQWEGQLTLQQVQDRQHVLRETMPRKGVDLHWHDSEISFLEGTLARGGRELSRVIERVWRAGGGFDAWTEVFGLSRWTGAFEAEGIDPVELASSPRAIDAALPWDHISSGVTKAYLAIERERALDGVVTPDCSFGDCTACGVCPSLGVDVVLAGESRG